MLFRSGDVLRQGGDGPAALASYRAGLAIREGLAKRDPNNSEWQRDLSVSWSNLGSFAVERKDWAEARAAFAKDLAIAERLAGMDRNNAEWQVDLAISHVTLVPLAEAPVAKRKHLEEAAAILRKLKSAGRLPPDRAGLLADVERDLAALGK